jgi:N utilization substance protein A
MELDVKQVVLAIKTIAEEKNLPENIVQEIVEQALIAAYRKDYGDRDQEIRLNLNLNKGDIDIYVTKKIVEEVSDPQSEISLKEAQRLNKDVELDQEIEVHQNITSFGRVAAQTAKQVILQKIRESEREVIFSEYENKIGSVLNANVSRIENGMVKVDLGKAQAIMPRSEQIQSEHYYPGQRIKVYLKEISRGFRGPELVVSRGCNEFIAKLFQNEVPEMENGAVEIKAIAREAGVRSKIAVISNVQGVDPVGTFVGGHGTRVNAVTSEVGEQEKIDIIVYDEDPKQYIRNALSPTEIKKVELNEKEKRATIHVNEDQLSIAIGKSGQNVRLASKLTGYELEIKAVDKTADNVTETVEKIKPPKLKKKSELESSLLEAIEEHSDENHN